MGGRYFRDGGSWDVWRKTALASYASDFENGNFFVGYWDYSAKKIGSDFFHRWFNMQANMPSL